MGTSRYREEILTRGTVPMVIVYAGIIQSRDTNEANEDTTDVSKTEGVDTAAPEEMPRRYTPTLLS